jgi:hypothetical protein
MRRTSEKAAVGLCDPASSRVACTFAPRLPCTVIRVTLSLHRSPPVSKIQEWHNLKTTLFTLRTITEIEMHFFCVRRCSISCSIAPLWPDSRFGWTRGTLNPYLPGLPTQTSR